MYVENIENRVDDSTRRDVGFTMYCTTQYGKEKKRKENDIMMHQQSQQSRAAKKRVNALYRSIKSQSNIFIFYYL
tara:strand:+ start:160 stop:384 length:225 start_codon:yes stop_codon:yes gene_type:complete